MFGNNYYTYNIEYVGGNLDTSIQMYMQHPEEVTEKPSYDTSNIQGVKGVDLLSTYAVVLSKSIAASIENNQEVQPDALHVNVSKQT